MTVASKPDSSEQRKVVPDELTEGFERLGLREGDSVVMHASLESMGVVEGGAAMTLHRLLRVLGKSGTLLMPTFTSITRHSTTHDNHTKPGCWCEGREDRHLPFIPELQPDDNIGEIAKRLCSWPNSRRSPHPAYSFVAVGRHCDELVREYSSDDPLLPLKEFLKRDPWVLTVGVGLDSVTAIHIAMQNRVKAKFIRERALTFTSKGAAWVNITALGCSNGFVKLRALLDEKEFRSTRIGLASSQVCSMTRLIERADSVLEQQPATLLCDNTTCLSCCVAE